MTAVPPSTFFSEAPDWGWLIVLYFFFGGLAGGSYFLAAMIDVLGRREDGPLARLGYYIAFPSVLVCAVLLIVDLGRPERFWHMLVQSNTYRPIFKYWSPISVGAWALVIFGAFCLVSFVGALVEDNRLAWPAGRRFRPPGLAALHRLDAWTIALEFVVLIAVMLSLGSIVRAWLNVWGLLLFFGVIVGGMVIPSAIYWRSRRPDGLTVTAAAVLVLLSGLI